MGAREKKQAAALEAEMRGRRGGGGAGGLGGLGLGLGRKAGSGGGLGGLGSLSGLGGGGLGGLGVGLGAGRPLGSLRDTSKSKSAGGSAAKRVRFSQQE